MVVGVLSLQGDFDLHVEKLESLNVETLKVKTSKDLLKTDGVIIPGGESTTISLLIDKLNLRKILEEYCSKKYVFGTCAGLIMISSIEDRIVKNFFKFGTFNSFPKVGIYQNEPSPFLIITKKPIKATEKEINKNNRARSAKLRIAEIKEWKKK